MDVLEMREREKETFHDPHVDKALFPAFLGGRSGCKLSDAGLSGQRETAASVISSR